MSKSFKVFMVSQLTIKDPQYDALPDDQMKGIISSAFTQKREDELFQEEVSVLHIYRTQDGG